MPSDPVSTFFAMSKRPSRIDLLELDIDLRLADLWRETLDVADWNLDVDAFTEALSGADAVLAPDAPFHIHFSDIQYANRNETKHLPYGEGTLRAEPLRDALARFERPATVISEAPDADSTRSIGNVLLGSN